MFIVTCSRVQPWPPSISSMAKPRRVSAEALRVTLSRQAVRSYSHRLSWRLKEMRPLSLRSAGKIYKETLRIPVSGNTVYQVVGGLGSKKTWRRIDSLSSFVSFIKKTSHKIEASSWELTRFMEEVDKQGFWVLASRPAYHLHKDEPSTINVKSIWKVHLVLVRTRHTCQRILDQFPEFLDRRWGYKKTEAVSYLPENRWEGGSNWGRWSRGSLCAHDVLFRRSKPGHKMAKCISFRDLKIRTFMLIVTSIDIIHFVRPIC